MSKTPILDAVMYIREAAQSSGVDPRSIEQFQFLLPETAFLIMQNAVSAEVGFLKDEKADLEPRTFKVAGLLFKAITKNPPVGAGQIADPE